MLDLDNARGGFIGSHPFGRRPALVVIDFQRAFTDPDVSPLASDCAPAIAQANRLIQAMRGRGPVVFTVVGYDGNHGDGGCFHRKCPPLKDLVRGSAGCALDERLDYDAATDVLLHKTQASAFFGTPLAAMLAHASCDAVLIAGCTTSGCVRASAVDAMQHGFPPFVAQDAVTDRSAAQHLSNLIDLKSKYAEVLPTDALLPLLLNPTA